MQHDFILLDRTGSMAGQWAEAIASVNLYVKKLVEEKVDTGVTLAVFDGNAGRLDFRVIRDRIIPSTWHEVSTTEVEPRGNTPLNDAIGEIVTLAKKGAPNGTQYDKLALVVMTDGEENASKEHTFESASKLLDDCRAKGWQVLFLGANFDNKRQSQHYGVAAAQSVHTSSANLSGMTRAVAEKRAWYGTGAVADMAFSDDEKDKLAKE